jgi:hypothetical protein
MLQALYYMVPRCCTTCSIAVMVIAPCCVVVMVTVIMLCGATVTITVVAVVIVGGWAMVGPGGRGHSYVSIGKQGNGGA